MSPWWWVGGVGAGLVLLWAATRSSSSAVKATPSPTPAPPQPPPQPSKQPPAPRPPAPAPVPSALNVRGALLAAVQRGELEEPSWVDVPWPDAGVVLTVGAHALRAPLGPEGKLVRVPSSYADGLRIDQLLGWIAPSAEVSDLLWQAATVRLTPVPMGASPLMASEGVVRSYNAKIDAQVPAGREGELAADEGKDWIVSNRNAFRSGRSATTYGWRQSSGVPIQTLGKDNVQPAHDDQHVDYSQLKRPIKRMARRISDGSPIDLVDVYAQRGLRADVLAPYTGVA